MSDRHKNKYNKTFRVGEIGLNACVGNNGWVDHETYEDGFHEAVEVLVNNCKENPLLIDCTIYPIVFCSRHRIELFLKGQLYRLRSLRDNKEITDKLLTSTHDLKVLWELFKEHSLNTDRRLRDFIKNAEEYILDFAEIDPTGETFRYPYSLDNRKHLVDTPIINIEILANRYSELSELMKEQTSLMTYLLGEYQTGTYTKELSRDDLFQIAGRLPDRGKWGDDEFQLIKESIMDEYGIGSRKFSEALNIIQKHRELCVKINIEVPLSELSLEKFEIYVDALSKIQKYRDDVEKERETKIEREHPGLSEMEKSIYKLSLSDLVYSDIEKECYSRFVSEFSEENIITLYALKELGYSQYFSEHFDFCVKEAKDDSETFGIDELSVRLLFNRRPMFYIYSGLLKLGQSSLLEIIPKHLLITDGFP